MDNESKTELKEQFRGALAVFLEKRLQAERLWEQKAEADERYDDAIAEEHMAREDASRLARELKLYGALERGQHVITYNPAGLLSVYRLDELEDEK